MEKLNHILPWLNLNMKTSLEPSKPKSIPNFTLNIFRFDLSATQPFNFDPLRCLKYFKQVRISFKIIYYSLTFAGMIFATIEKPNDYSEGTFKITQVSYYQLRVATTGFNAENGYLCELRFTQPWFQINPTLKWPYSKASESGTVKNLTFWIF